MGLSAPGSAGALLAAADDVPPARRRRQEWMGLGVLLLLLGAAIGGLLYRERGQTTTREVDRLQTQAKVIDDNLVLQLAAANLALESVRSEFLQPHAGDGLAALSARMKVLSDAMPGVRTVALLDVGGTIVASSRKELLAKNYAQRDYFDVPRRHPDPATLYVTPPYKTVLGIYTINIGRALIRPDGQFAGVVVATLDPDYFRLLLRSVIYASDMRTAAIHPDGKAFLSEPPNAKALDQDLAVPGSFLTLHLNSGQPSSVYFGPMYRSGADRMLVLRTVTQASLHMDKPLVVATSRELSALYLPWRMEAQTNAGLYALLACAASLVLSLIQRRRQTFDRLAAASAAGLAAALRDNDALLRTIHLHSIVSVADSAGRIVDVNDSFCSISGYARDELLGQTHHIVNAGYHDSGFWAEMWRTIGAGQPWRGEICNRAKDGSLYWVDCQIAPFVGADGRVEKYISIRTDITAAKKTEQRLRASEAFLDRVGGIAGIGGWELDLRTGAVVWSAHTYAIHEVAPGLQPPLDEALNFYAPEARPVVERALADAMAQGQGWDLELPFVTARGRAIWVRTVGLVELDGGRALRMVGTLQDVTARRQTEAALRETNERFAIAADAAAIGVWDFDVPNNTLVWDDWMYRLYGAARRADVEPYALWAGILHPADRARCEGLIARAVAGQGEFDTEFRIVRSDGEVRTLKGVSRTLRAADGTALRMTGVNFDITELERAKARLLQTSSRLRSVLDAASEVSIIASDCDLRIQLFNTGAEHLLGYASEELVGCATPAVFHDAEELHLRSQELTARLGRSVVGTAVFTEPSTLHQAREWTYVRKDGSRVQVSLVVTAMHTGEGELLGYLGIAHEVTQQKEYEASLREAMGKAEQASRAKSEFLANMSHEIRTPLNAVIGLSYVLRRMGLDTEQAACVGKIELAGKSLLAVIDDVLDLSKVEAGALVIEHAGFCPRDLLQALAAVMKAQAQAKGIAFDIDLPHDLPEVLAGDARRLNQILLNLVSNAIKFTDQGQVCLRVRQLGVAADAVTLGFVVQDTGIGIAPEVQACLFAPFTQADASITRRFGGTGLGLSIVRRLARLMGGEVSLTSTLGVGSEFTVVLDFALAGPQVSVLPDDAQGPCGEDALLGVRVLVVDDSPINRDVARRILELSGAQVELAPDGQRAIECLLQRPDGFDVVLMDVQMPVLDGLEATRRIRLEPGLADLAIIALTAGALSSEHDRALAAGMDDFITKPFDVEVLVASILQHLPRARRRLPPQGASRSACAPLAWPQIEGIDTADARTRLVGDSALFLNLLEQLLDECADLAIPAPNDAAAALAGHAARLHRIGGSAGMLGAKAVRECASAAETACIAGDAVQAAALVTRLVAELQSLRENAGTEFAGARARAAASSPDASAGASAFDPGRLAEPGVARMEVAEMLGLLRRKSLSALDRYTALSGPLRRHLGQDRHALVQGCIERLQFDAAETALLEGEAPLGVPSGVAVAGA